MPPPDEETATGGSGGLSSQELRDEWGLDTLGTVEGTAAFDAFWPFVPQNIRVRTHINHLIINQSIPPPPVCSSQLMPCNLTSHDPRPTG